MRLRFSLIMIGCIALTGIWRADAAEPVLQAGQVKMSTPIPLTLSPGMVDTAVDARFFARHPQQATPWKNFTTALKDILFPDQTVQIDDVALFGISKGGKCKELTAILGKHVTMVSQTAEPFTDVGYGENLEVFKPLCAQLMTFDAAIDGEFVPAQGIPITPNWCETFHEGFDANGNNANLDPLCEPIANAELAFGGVIFGGFCSSYLSCPSTHKWGSTFGYAVDAYCWKQSLTAECINAGYYDPGDNPPETFDVKKEECLMALYTNTALFCDGKVAPDAKIGLKAIVNQCLSPNTLCTGVDATTCSQRKSVCKDLVQLAVAHSDAVCNLSGGNCYGGVAHDFLSYCDKKKALKEVNDFTAEGEEQCAATESQLGPLAEVAGACTVFLGCAGGTALAGTCPAWQALCQEKGYPTNVADDGCFSAGWTTQCQTMQPILASCGSDNMCQGLDDNACMQLQLICGLLSGEFPLSRIVLGDIRSATGTAQVTNESEVVFSGENVLPYPLSDFGVTYPASLMGVRSGAVVEGEEWIDGMAVILKDPRPQKVSGLSNSAQLSLMTYGYPGVAYYRFSTTNAVPLLRMHSVSPGFLTDHLIGPKGACEYNPKLGATGAATFFQSRGCVLEQNPIAIVALDFVGHADPKGRDLVIVNDATLPADPARAYVTVHENVDPTFAANAKTYTDLFAYAGFGALSSRKPFGQCVHGNALYVPLNRPRDGKYYVDRVTYNTEEPLLAKKVVVEPIVVGEEITPDNKLNSFGPYKIACGDWNGDTLPDFALTWAELDDTGMAIDFRPDVSIFAKTPAGTYLLSNSLGAMALKHDGTDQPTAADTEFSAIVRCDLNKDGRDDLCVGDQRVYQIDGKPSVFMTYFRMNDFGYSPAETHQQLIPVNAGTSVVFENEIAGVTALTVDRFENLVAVLRPPALPGFALEVVCFDRDNDGIGDYPDKVIFNANIKDFSELNPVTEAELIAAANAICLKDNCPEGFPDGTKNNACQTEVEGNSEGEHPCWNPSQLDADGDGKGDVCEGAANVDGGKG
ncbi:MAG: hypothetical protein HYV02_01490 [Deltaproteobacteria bacterium]|nr:hypothetical protein [Deltaproteobacteria bacterium]